MKPSKEEIEEALACADRISQVPELAKMSFLARLASALERSKEEGK